MFTRLVLFVLLVAVASGCGGLQRGAAKIQAENALKALSIEYYEYQKANSGRAPASADELAAFVRLRGDEATLKPAERRR